MQIMKLELGTFQKDKEEINGLVFDLCFGKIDKRVVKFAQVMPNFRVGHRPQEIRSTGVFFQQEFEVLSLSVFSLGAQLYMKHTNNKKKIRNVPRVDYDPTLCQEVITSDFGTNSPATRLYSQPASLLFFSAYFYAHEPNFCQPR